MSAHTSQLGRLCRSKLEPIIREANLGEIDEYLCKRYLIDKVPQIEIAAELEAVYGLEVDRSTVTRHWRKCKAILEDMISRQE